MIMLTLWCLAIIKFLRIKERNKRILFRPNERFGLRLGLLLRLRAVCARLGNGTGRGRDPLREPLKFLSESCEVALLNTRLTQSTTTCAVQIVE